MGKIKLICQKCRCEFVGDTHLDRNGGVVIDSSCPNCGSRFVAPTG